MSLPLFKIVLASFAVIALHWRRFLTVSLLPVPVMFFVGWSILPHLEQSMVPEQSMIAEQSTLSFFTEIDAGQVLLLLLGFYMTIIWAIAIYRIVLLGDEGAFTLADFLPSSRLARFAMMVLRLILLVIAIMFAVALLSALLPNQLLLMFVIFPAGLFVLFYWLIIFSLRFPAIAIDENYQSNQLPQLKKQMPQLFLLLVVLPALIPILPGYLIDTFVSGGLAKLLLIALQQLVNFWLMICLALCYQELKKLTNVIN